jgi:hypothetical protein
VLINREISYHPFLLPNNHHSLHLTKSQLLSRKRRRKRKMSRKRNTKINMKKRTKRKRISMQMSY